MKGQDLLVLLKLVTLNGQKWQFAQLAEELAMSASEVHSALRRSEESGLYNFSSRKLNGHGLLEFLVHGVQYVFPAKPGAITQGLVTSYAAEPLSQRIRFDEAETPVMPLLHGPARGPEICPLYASAPKAAARDQQLHRLLALVDALRSGRARERKLAGELLRQELKMA